MPRRVEALAATKPPVAPVALTPHERARRDLADAIAASVSRHDALSDLAERLEHGETILAQALDDRAGAERLVTEAKRQALFNAGSDWRDAAGIAEAQAVLADAGERIDLARGAINQIVAEQAQTERAASGDHHRINEMVSAVVRTSPQIAAVVTDATVKRREWREAELVLNALRSHFPGELPGWEPVRIFSTPPTRDREWLHAIERLKVDATTDFPP